MVRRNAEGTASSTVLSFCPFQALPAGLHGVLMEFTSMDKAERLRANVESRAGITALRGLHWRGGCERGRVMEEGKREWNICKELSPEDEPDSELREIMNELARCTNRSNQRMGLLMEGIEKGLSPAELKKLRKQIKEDDKALAENRKRLKAYAKRK